MTPTPLRRQFFTIIRRQIWQILDPSPPHLVHVVIECPLTILVRQNTGSSRLVRFLRHGKIRTSGIRTSCVAIESTQLVRMYLLSPPLIQTFEN